MADFTPLESLLAWDFSQLRANKGKATDEALRFFTTQLNTFFRQFKANPSKDEISQFDDLISQIMDKINTVERDYQEKKYSSEPELMIIDLKEYETTFKKLPQRMQYWAATEEFGGTIRNVEEHKKTVNFINKWPNLVSKRPDLFVPKIKFNPSDDSEDKEVLKKRKLF